MREEYSELDYENHLAAINYFKRTLWKGALISFVLAAAAHYTFKYFSNNLESKVADSPSPANQRND